MKQKTTADTVGEFFRGLAERRREPLLQNVSGTLRFDLLDGERVEHWYLTITNGDVAVSHTEAEADAIVRTGKALFDGMIAGKVNAMAAALRGGHGVYLARSHAGEERFTGPDGGVCLRIFV